MQQLQLYIENERVDLFEDESVVVTDSIKDLKDITKIYTAFSQQFNLPATKKNNRIFKHYYNYNIINGYDARIRTNAILKVNGVDYKIGKIQLNSVDLKSNVPYSYKVVFYGNTVTLKDLIGDDKLEDLDLSDYNHAYDGTTQITGIEDELFSGVIKYPFISHTKNFDVSNADGVYEFGTTNVPNYADFKPAIRIKEIFDAIGTKYGLTFGNNFFGSSYFNQLYLWLHKNKGGLKNAEEVTQTITNQDDFTYLPLTSSQDLISDGLVTYYNGIEGVRYYIEWEVTIGAAQEYVAKVVDRNTNQTIIEEQVSGTTTVFTVGFLESNGQRQWDLDFIIESDTTLNMTQTLLIEKELYNFEIYEWVAVADANYERGSIGLENTLVISQHMPKVKTLDFIKDIFKMHNLVSFIERDGLDEIVQVEDLPLFYNEYNTYEISKYVDVKKTSIEKFYPYKEISLTYEGQKTFLTEALNDFKTGADFGNLDYLDGNPIDKDAGKYEIKVGFEKMYFERLIYTDTGNKSPIQWGYYVDKDQNPFVNKPLVFMIENRNTLGQLDINDGSSDVALSTYNAPVNNLLPFSFGQVSLHFGLELDEWTGEQINPNSTLFSRYYKDYIQRIYNPQSRKMVCTAYLPMHVLLKYKLDDTFIINNRRWKIESIKTNFLKKESKLTLFNDLEQELLAATGINPQAPTVTGLTATNATNPDVDLNWDAVAGAVEYNIYIEGNLIDDTTSTSYTLKVDDNSFTYNLGVQVVYSDYSSKIIYVQND